MSEEIVIKTETVKVEDLEGREKQIWQHGYAKGKEDAPSRWEKAHTAKVILLIIIIIGLYWNIFKSF